MRKSSKSSRNTGILERPKGRFSIEDEFLTPSASSYSPTKLFTSTARARVQALTSKLSTSTSKLDFDTHHLLDDASPGRSSDYKNEQKLTPSDTFLGKLGKGSLSTSLPVIQSYDDVYSSPERPESKDNRRGNTARTISWSTILVPKKIGSLGANTSSRSTNDLSVQHASRNTSKDSVGTIYSSLIDLNSEDSTSYNIAPSRPTPSPRTSLSPKRCNILGSDHGTDLNSRNYGVRGPAHYSGPTALSLEPRVDIRSSVPSRSTSTNDYPAEKDPFATPPSIQTRLPGTKAASSEEEPRARWQSLFTANISSDPTRIFDRKPTSSVSSLSNQSDASWHGSTSSARNNHIIMNGSVSRGSEPGILSRIDRPVSMNSDLLSRTGMKSSVFPLPETRKANENVEEDRPKIHRALTDLQYSFQQSASYSAAESLYRRPELKMPPPRSETESDKSSRISTPGPELPPTTCPSNLPLISFVDNLLSPQHIGDPPPLPSVPPPDDSSMESQRKNSIAELSAGFDRWSQRIFSSEEPAPLIELAHNEIVGSATAHIGANKFKLPLKKLAPSPSEQRVLRQGTEHETPAPARRTFVANEGWSAGAKSQETRKDESINFQNGSERDLRSTLPSPNQPGDSPLTIHDRLYCLETGSRAGLSNASSQRRSAASTKAATLPAMHLNTEKGRDARDPMMRPQPSVESLFEYALSNKFPHSPGPPGKSLHRFPSGTVTKTNVHLTPSSTNPFGSSDSEFFDEARPSLSDCGIRDSPLQSSTPNGTLKKKFGGTGLLHAWSNDFSTSASEIHSETSLNMIGYRDGTDSAEGSIESLRVLNIHDGENENNPFNPFFDEVNEDSVDPKHIGEVPLRPPRRNRSSSQSRHSMSYSSMEESQSNARHSIEEPMGDAPVEGEASEATINDDDGDESIDLNLSRPLPPLPALPDRSKLADPDASISLHQGGSRGGEPILNSTEEKLEPNAVGKLASSVSSEKIDIQPTVEVSRMENSVATICDELQKSPNRGEDSADLNESDSLDKSVQRKAKSKVVNKRKKGHSRLRARERTLRPRKAGSIVIQYIYNTTAPAHEIASGNERNDNPSNSLPESCPQSRELCVEDPSAASSTANLREEPSQIADEQSKVPATDPKGPSFELEKPKNQISGETIVGSNTPERPAMSGAVQGKRSLSKLFLESSGVWNAPTGLSELPHGGGRGSQEIEESPSPEESYVQESPSTSETSYDTDPEDPEFIITTPEYTEMSRRRVLSVIHEYSEDESFESKVPGVVEQPANRNEEFFFVESVQEDEDEFQVHKVIHDDSDFLDSKDSRGGDTAEETTRSKTSDALSAGVPEIGSRCSLAIEYDTEHPSNHVSVNLRTSQAIEEVADSSDVIGEGTDRLETTETEMQADATTRRNKSPENDKEFEIARPSQMEKKMPDGRNTVTSNCPMRRSQKVQSLIEALSENLSKENTEPSEPVKFSRPTDDSKNTPVVRNASENLSDAEQTLPAKVSKLHDRPSTLRLTEHLLQASVERSNAVSQGDCALRDIPVNHEKLHDSVTSEQLPMEIRMEQANTPKPSEFIETPSTPRTPSYDDADDVKVVEPDSEEVDTLETPTLPPRTLPLPPMELISRRYSEGDVTSGEKRSSHRKCPRRNSVSPPANAGFVDVDLNVPTAALDDTRREDSRTRSQRPDPDAATIKTQKSIRRPGIAPPKPPPKLIEAVEGVIPQLKLISPENSEESSVGQQITKSLSERFAEARASQSAILPELFSQNTPTPPAVQLPRVTPQRRPAPPVPAPRKERQTNDASMPKKSGFAEFHFHPPPSLADTSVGRRAEEQTKAHSPASQENASDLPEVVDSATAGEDSEPATIAAVVEVPLQGNLLEGDRVDSTRDVASPSGKSERRNSESIQAERIFGRSICITKGSDKLLLQCRQIEEQQANLSAEARLVERQLYEATKDTALRGDLPRLDLDQETGKYRVSNEVSLELLPETLVADLYRILNVKNQLVEKHREIKFLQLYNELQREQLEIETKLRSLESDKGGSQADVDFEKALIEKLLEIVEQRNKMVEAMDGNLRRTTPLGELSRSNDDVSDEPLPSIQSSKALITPSGYSSQSGAALPRKKRKGVRHFVKKRYKRVFK